MRRKKPVVKPVPDVAETSDLSHWLSTYGRLTVERLLETFRVEIDPIDLHLALGNNRSLIYHLLQLPLENISSRLVGEQTYEYQAYAQKIMIDYLLSGQNDLEDGDDSGAEVRALIDLERENLISMGERFDAHHIGLRRLIAESQAALIKSMKNFEQDLQTAARDGFFHLEGIKSDMAKRILMILLATQNGIEVDARGWDYLTRQLNLKITDSYKQKLLTIIEPLFNYINKIGDATAAFHGKTREFADGAREFRRTFFELILRMTDLVHMLPNYLHNEERENKNRALLDFDRQILEEKE